MKKVYPAPLLLVIGNSGSGKDSIIRGVVEQYPSNLIPLRIVKRYITRPPSDSEKNISITPEQFQRMKRKGKFAFSWHIYGLDYGVPIEIENWLEDGHPVVVNVSRTVINDVKQKYANLKVIFVKVPFEITLKRIKERGRESGYLLEERINRARSNQDFPGAYFIVDNSGKLEDSINQLLEYILRLIKS